MFSTECAHQFFFLSIFFFFFSNNLMERIMKQYYYRAADGVGDKLLVNIIICKTNTRCTRDDCFRYNIHRVIISKTRFFLRNNTRTLSQKFGLGKQSTWLRCVRLAVVKRFTREIRGRVSWGRNKLCPLRVHHRATSAADVVHIRGTELFLKGRNY
jgi:hypothetical protein